MKHYLIAFFGSLSFFIYSLVLTMDYFQYGSYFVMVLLFGNFIDTVIIFVIIIICMKFAKPEDEVKK